MKKKVFTNTEYNVQNNLVVVLSEEISVIKHKDIPQWFTDAIVAKTGDRWPKDLDKI